jgi:hypothetical protein
LIAVAAPDVSSSDQRGSSRISSVPGPQITGRNWIVRGASHETVSSTPFSAQPTISRRLFAPAAYPLMPPPSVGSALITLPSQAKPRHVYRERSGPGKNEAQLHVAADGCSTCVCAIPTMSPESFFTGQATLLLEPPSVPRLTRRP